MRGPYLLDTNVISEFTKPRPHLGVVNWLRSVNYQAHYVSAITAAELEYGIAILADGKRKTALADWYRDQFHQWFDGRILAFDAHAARHFAHLKARAKRYGAPRPDGDLVIAAIASAHDLTVVTRNLNDFERLDLRVFNPWQPD